jgi:molybdenum cofactor cytidylyltransferase
LIGAASSAAIVLAAGSATRFGSPKALAPLAGRPILQHVLDVAAQLDFAALVVVLGRSAEEIERRLHWRSECRILNPDPDAGLSSSLRIGLDALEQLDPVPGAALIMLGDQPLVRAEVIEALLGQLEFGPEGESKPIVAPRYRDGGGPNPLLIGRPAWPIAREARGDRGLGPVIREHSDLVRWVDVDGSNPDVDTQADLDALEAAVLRADWPSAT